MATPTFDVRLQAIRWEADDIVSLELRSLDGAPLPAFDAGSHVDLHLPNGLVRSYSLSNDARERDRYVVGVLKDRASRGGSRCVHEQLRVGMTLPIAGPRNNFVLDETAAHTVLVAGGIGITPLLAMARRLRQLDRSFEMLYFSRARTAAAFKAEIDAMGVPVHWHFDAEAGGPPDLKALLAARAPRPGSGATHYYACGPTVMLDAFERECAALGYTHAHIERFAAVEKAAAEDAVQAYTVEARKSGKIIEVKPDRTLLQCLRDAGVDVATSCEEGICGSCETRVIEGLPDHRDSVLSEAERTAGKTMMVCVSGCRSARLVLDA